MVPAPQRMSSKHWQLLLRKYDLLKRRDEQRPYALNKSNIPYQKCLGPELLFKTDSVLFNYV